MTDAHEPGPCPYCGTQMVNTGSPIWEDYCPNDDCHGHAEEFAAGVRRAIKQSQELRAAKESAYIKVQKLQSEIDRLRPMSQSNSMLDHGRRQMLDHFEATLKGGANGS